MPNTANGTVLPASIVLTGTGQYRRLKTGPCSGPVPVGLKWLQLESLAFQGTALTEVAGMRVGEPDETFVDIAEGLWPVTGERLTQDPFSAGEPWGARRTTDNREFTVAEFEGYKVMGYQSNAGLSDWVERWVLLSVLDSSLAGFRANALTVYDVLRWTSFWVRDRTVAGNPLQAWYLFGREDLPDQGKALTEILTNYCSTITGEYWEGLARSDGLWPVLGTPVSTRPFRQMRLIETIARPGRENLFLSEAGGVTVLCVRAALGDEQALERWVFVEVLGDALGAIKAGRSDVRQILANSKVWVMDRSHSACTRAWQLPGLSALPEGACPFTVRPKGSATPSSDEFSCSTGWRELDGLPARPGPDAGRTQFAYLEPATSEPDSVKRPSLDIVLPVSPSLVLQGRSVGRGWLQVSAFVLLLIADIHL